MSDLKIQVNKEIDYFSNLMSENPILLNTIYEYAKKRDNGQRYDVLTLIYKDAKTDEKFIKTIEKPFYDVYFTKEGEDYNEVQPYIRRDCVDKYSIPYMDNTKFIAHMGGQVYQDYFSKCIKERRWGALKNLHKYKHAHSTDIDIEDFYRIEFLKKYGSRKMSLDRGFLDIEVDIINSKTNNVNYLKEKADCPINVATIVYKEQGEAYTFILRNPENPQIEELEEDLEGFIEEVHDEFDEKFGRLHYNIIFFDDEKDLIKMMIGSIHHFKPDFMMIWNMDFDIPYIINRCKKIGLDYKKLFTHPDFTYKQCKYIEDIKCKKIALKNSRFICSSYTSYMDQMVNFAVIRKGGKELRNNKLDYISKQILGEGKVNYSNEGGAIATFPWRNFRKFVLYNIKDVLLQVGIDDDVRDMDHIYKRSLLSGTRYHKVFKQSIYLKNYAHLTYPTFNYILGNNHNIDYGYLIEMDDNENQEIEKHLEKFEGAIVGNPNNNDYKGILINGVRSMYVFDLVVDFDYSSLYPSIRNAFNIEITTQHFRLQIDDKISDLENPYNYDKYDRGGNFIDDLQTKNYNIIGNKWFGLDTTESLIEEFGMELEQKQSSSEENARVKDIIKQAEKLNLLDFNTNKPFDLNVKLRSFDLSKFEEAINKKHDKKGFVLQQLSILDEPKGFELNINEL